MLLELLEVFFVGAALDQGVDVVQVALGGDVKAGILLADATVTTGREGAGRGVWSHALGARAGVHLLLVEGHPVGVGVGGHGLLWCGLEDGTGADVLVHGESVEGHLGLVDKGSGTKVTGAKRVEGLGGSGCPGARVVGNGP